MVDPSFFVGVERYAVNRFYARRAERDFVKSTTTTNVKRTLAIQAFWDRIFRVDWIASWLATGLRSENRAQVPAAEGTTAHTLTLAGCTIQAEVALTRSSPDGVSLRVDFEVIRGRLAHAALGLGLELGAWEPDGFVCAPGASYNAGRFERYKTIYPPFLPRERWRQDLPIITSEIPGLAIDRDTSRMDLRLGEITSPMIGIWFANRSRCLWIRTDPRSTIAGNGFSVREDQPERMLTVELMSPVVRERVRSHGASTLPSWDQGRELVEGDRAVLEMALELRDCSSTEEFYAGFREMLTRAHPEPALAVNSFPLSAAWERIENQYNERKWSAEFGYYHAGFLPPFIPAEAWSAGWTGGLALSYALLGNGQEQSRDRALENLAFFFRDGGQSRAGIFYSTSDGTRWGGDDYFVTDSIGHRDCIHVRRCGDYLYFLIKHFHLLDARGESHRIDESWLDKTRRCAGYFGRPEYLDVATAALTTYHDDFVAKGFTAGGPLEILCAPDCESAFNLLESMIVVYEQTGDPSWLVRAHRYSDYVRTWFYTYDVAFPPDSTYGRLGIRTTGSMMASSQNRCAVPNICTLSGDALWKLFRHTGDESLLRLLQACVHNAQQYVSREDRAIPTMRGRALSPGTIHECIQTGDWSGPTGEIPYEYPTSWSEVAHLLAIAEIPGIYLIADQARVFVFDHLDVEVMEDSSGAISLEIHNPTRFASRTRLYVETTDEMQHPLPFDISRNCVDLRVEPGQTIHWQQPRAHT